MPPLQLRGEMCASRAWGREAGGHMDTVALLRASNCPQFHFQTHQMCKHKKMLWAFHILWNLHTLQKWIPVPCYVLTALYASELWVLHQFSQNFLFRIVFFSDFDSSHTKDLLSHTVLHSRLPFLLLCSFVKKSVLLAFWKKKPFIVSIKQLRLYNNYPSPKACLTSLVYRAAG